MVSVMSTNEINDDVLKFPPNSVHIIMAIPRKKENAQLTGRKPQRAAFIKMVSSKKEWNEQVAALLKTLNHLDPDFTYRIYTTYNPRSLKKAVKSLADAMLNAMHNGDYNTLKRDGLVISHLKREGSYASRDYYLVDIDTKNPETVKYVRDIVSEHSTNVHLYHTPHGFHLIAKPFDVRILAEIPDVSIKKDELLYVGMVGQE